MKLFNIETEHVFKGVQQKYFESRETNYRRLGEGVQILKLPFRFSNENLHH
jgi:hypothetical protein